MSAFEEFVAKRGNKAFLAAQLGITHAAVQQWGGRVPAERVVDVERITGIPREALRPDLYRLKPAIELPARSAREAA